MLRQSVSRPVTEIGQGAVVKKFFCFSETDKIYNVFLHNSQNVNVRRFIFFLGGGQ